jgi:hypothetical protein
MVAERFQARHPSPTTHRQRSHSLSGMMRYSQVPWVIDHILIFCQVSPSQLEAQSPPYLVHVARTEKHDLLTSALHHRQMISEYDSFTLETQRFVRNPSSLPVGSQRALMLDWEYDKGSVIFMGVVVTLLSVIAGVVVGVLNHDASLGIAVSSGMAAVLSCLEVLVLWQFR